MHVCVCYQLVCRADKQVFNDFAIHYIKYAVAKEMRLVICVYVHEWMLDFPSDF